MRVSLPPFEADAPRPEREVKVEYGGGGHFVNVDDVRHHPPPFWIGEHRLKGIIRGVALADKIDAHAFRLIGESQGVIDNEASELFEALQHQLPPFSRAEAFGLAFALRELIRERIREIEETCA